MSESEFTKRIEERIRHFDGLADRFRNLFMAAKTAQIAFIVLVPVMAAIPGGDWQRPVTAASGAIVIGIETFLQTFQVQHYWIIWRGTQRRLQFERNLYLNTACPYKGLAPPQASELLAERVEDYLLHEEYQGWREITEVLGKQEAAKAK